MNEEQTQKVTQNKIKKTLTNTRQKEKKISEKKKDKLRKSRNQNVFRRMNETKIGFLTVE